MIDAYAGKPVLVLGLGDTGLSMARWLVGCGATVRVADTRSKPPHGARLKRDFPAAQLHLGAFSQQLLDGVDLVAISPGVPLSEPILRRADGAGIPIVGDVELFGRALGERRVTEPGAKQAKVLGITGSNGKSTVTTMVGEICKSAGLNTIVAGNIGLPVLDALPPSARDAQSFVWPDVYVLELSSFQLETTSHLRLDAGTVLNISEDHMDRYADLGEYMAAKRRIFLDCAVQVLNADDPLSLGMAEPSRRVMQFGSAPPQSAAQWGIVSYGGARWLANGSQRLLSIDELPVTGLHNAVNALAALALTQAIELPTAAALAALRRFRGLPHRVEKVMEIDGVRFFDDSKGTNVGATVAALKGMTEQVVLIAGGEGKDQDFAPLMEPIRAKARAVVLIGRDAEVIARAIEPSGAKLLRASDMHDAVRQAYQAAKAGDAVLLSPACASFDMFNNYAHRAQVFVEAVRALAQSVRSNTGRAA